jgi:hypothetical protein
VYFIYEIYIYTAKAYPGIFERGRGAALGSSEETGKTKVPCHSRCGTIKILSCSKALSIEHRPKFCSFDWQW